MASTQTNGGDDPARALAILWGTQQRPRRGPKHTLTAEQVIRAAVRLADRDHDLDALSMRRIAESLDVGTMSLYTYIASREVLLQAMLDAVYREVVEDLAAAEVAGSTGAAGAAEVAGPAAGVAEPAEVAVTAATAAAGSASWQDRLRRVARANWDLYLRHPWVLQIFTGRPPLGPQTMAKYELELRAVEGIGLTDVEMDAVVTVVLTHVEGVARRRIDADRVVRRTGMSDAQWWERVGPVLAEVFDPAQFPVAARVGQAAGQAHQAAHNPEHAFAFGLERLIAGVESLVAARATPSDPS